MTKGFVYFGLFKSDNYFKALVKYMLRIQFQAPALAPKFRGFIYYQRNENRLIYYPSRALPSIRELEPIHNAY